MSFEELGSPITPILPEDQPDIMAYSLLRNFVADLNPTETTPGMNIWAEFRFRSTGEFNHARWAKTIEINDVHHTVALYGVHGEMPGGKRYGHSALRCSCSLPDYKSYRDLGEEYEACPAKDLVIDQRIGVYKQLVGGDVIGAFDDESLQKVTVFLLGMVRRNPQAWPPSDRSDRLLVAPISEIFGVPENRMRAGVEDLAANQVVQLHGDKHLSISLAA